MPRPEKVQAVADIKERIQGAQAVFLAEYAGLSVKHQQELRRELRANGAEFKVVKMTLARLATGELKIDSLDDLLFGPTGLAFADGDPVGAAKVLKGFAKEHGTFVVKGGLLGMEFLTPEKIAELAEIEPREVLLAKLAGVMQAPAAKLAGLLAALPRNAASVFQQLLEQKEADEQTTAQAEPAVETEPAVEAEPTAATDEESDLPAVAEEESSGDSADDVTETEDVPEVTAEASDDAGAETENQADEASDDAEEE